MSLSTAMGSADLKRFDPLGEERTEEEARTDVEQVIVRRAARTAADGTRRPAERTRARVAAESIIFSLLFHAMGFAIESC
mmetsp:Transcript_31174/g.68439  ORF Transcript_31174/g.68439 Transcript_31174/m.68439 type:complete len:80 (-) Transcript_31174:79-318(-)